MKEGCNEIICGGVGLVTFFYRRLEQKHCVGVGLKGGVGIFSALCPGDFWWSRIVG